MNSEDFFDRERELAERFGLRKLDVMLQSLRCETCDAEALRINRYAGFAYASVEDVEAQMLASISEAITARCSACQGESFSGAGPTHLFLVYSESHRAHLGVRLRLSGVGDRTKVVRQLWWMPLDGTTEEVDPDDPKLADVWTESALRGVITHPEQDDVEAAVRALAESLPTSAIVWRVLGELLIEHGHGAVAPTVLERSLTCDPDQPEVMRRLGLLYASYDEGARATKWLKRCFERTDDTELLADLLRAAYRGRQLGALEQAARETCARDPDTVAGYKALVCCGSALDIGTWRDAWRALRRAASRAGERHTEAVAAWWADVLDVPWPDWPPDADRTEFRQLLVASLMALDFEVDDAPLPLAWGDGSLPVDVTFSDWGGRRFAVVLSEALPLVHEQQRIRAIAAAIDEDADLADASLVLLSKQPPAWASLRHVTRTPDALLDLAADADTTMYVNDENAAAFAAAAERHFGRSLDFSLGSLEDVDAIVLRYHDEGLGDLSFALQCQAAAYVGEVIERCMPGTRWVDGEAPMDPRVLELPDHGQMNLVSKVGKLARNGPEDSLAHFVRTVLGPSEAEAP